MPSLALWLYTFLLGAAVAAAEFRGVPAAAARPGGGAVSSLPTGTIEFERVSRSYRLMLERNFTLKETLLRKGRVRAHTIDTP
ncbi:MAG: hypothetical protein U0Y82_04440 [Thermoleophilia bacterium]